MLACRGSRGTLEKSPFPDGDCGLSACQCRLSDSQSIITRFGCLGEQIKTCYRSEKIYRTNKMYSYVDWPPLPSLLPLRLAAIDWVHGAGIVRPYVFAHQNAARLIRRTKKKTPWNRWHCPPDGHGCSLIAATVVSFPFEPGVVEPLPSFFLGHVGLIKDWLGHAHGHLSASERV